MVGMCDVLARASCEVPFVQPREQHHSAELCDQQPLLVLGLVVASCWPSIASEPIELKTGL